MAVFGSRPSSVAEVCEASHTENCRRVRPVFPSRPTSHSPMLRGDAMEPQRKPADAATPAPFITGTGWGTGER